MLSENAFTKENLDTYLRELGKEYRRLNGKNMPAEIILIGGAAIIANYGFRDMTTDVDAIIHAMSSMKDAINRVGDKYNLPSAWLNADFVKTGSYSPKLDEFSVHYKVFSNVLHVRTVAAEYLVAMKLCAGRKYKNDLSDVIGILAEHQKRGSPISFDAVSAAVINLYGSWDSIPQDSRAFIADLMKRDDLQALYEQTRADEIASKELITSFDKDYPGVANTDNAENILKTLKAKLNTENK